MQNDFRSELYISTCPRCGTRLGMDKAGIGITAEKVRDSLWTPKGIIGFHRMAFRTPECALPIQVQKTSVTVNDRATPSVSHENPRSR